MYVIGGFFAEEEKDGKVGQVVSLPDVDTGIVLLRLVYTDRIIEPTLMAMAEVKAKSVLAYMVNEAVKEKFTEDIDSGNLMTS